MKIVKSQVSVHETTFKLPLQNQAKGRSDRVVLQVEMDSGETAFGLTGRFLARAVATTLHEHLLPAVADMDLADVEAVHARLRPLLTARGEASGVAVAALSCLDIAIWDALGKRYGRSVAGLLGGAADGADVYVTYGFGSYDEDQLVELGRMLVGQGFRGLKILVGGTKGGVAEDARRVKAVRRALGDDVLIGIDANESLTFDQALRLCRLVRDEDIAWFEEPLARGVPSLLRDLRTQGGIPVALGQFDGTLHRFQQWAQAGAIDLFTPNSMYNGGFTETRRVAALSQAYGLPLSDAGGGGIVALHHVAAMRNGTMTEMHLGIDGVDRRLYLDLPEPRAGRLLLPNAPGLGVALNPEFLAETQTAVWTR